jgi:hypothetical protein
MTHVHGSCPRCGDVAVPVTSLSVEAPSAEQPGSYVYACPACTNVVRASAGARLAEVLVVFRASVGGVLEPSTAPVVHLERDRMDADAVARVHLFAA